MKRLRRGTLDRESFPDTDLEQLNKTLSNRPSKQNLVERGILRESITSPQKERHSTLTSMSPPEKLNTSEKPNRPEKKNKNRSIAGFLTGRTKIKRENSDMPNKLKHTNVFGVPLGQVMYTSYTEFRIPQFVVELFKILEQTGFSEVGLFRISGANTEVLELKDLINRSEPIDYSKYSIHSLASTLKLFFRELPEPIFPYSMYTPFVKLLDLTTIEQKIETAKTLLKEFPPTNYYLLGKLCFFLNKMLPHQEVTKMNCQNLGIVFGPTLLWQKDADPMAAMVANSKTGEVLEFMLENVQLIFNPEMLLTDAWISDNKGVIPKVVSPKELATPDTKIQQNGNLTTSQLITTEEPSIKHSSKHTRVRSMPVNILSKQDEIPIDRISVKKTESDIVPEKRIGTSAVNKPKKKGVTFGGEVVEIIEVGSRTVMEISSQEFEYPEEIIENVSSESSEDDKSEEEIKPSKNETQDNSGLVQSKQIVQIPVDIQRAPEPAQEDKDKPPQLATSSSSANQDVKQEIPNLTQYNASNELQHQETSLNETVNEENKPSDSQKNETSFHNLQQETPKHPKEASIQQAQLELIENTPQNQETQTPSLQHTSNQVENQVSPSQNTVAEKETNPFQNEGEISTDISQNDEQESPIQQEIPNPTQHNASDELQRQETSLNGIVNEESKLSDPQRNENETPFHNLQQETQTPSLQHASNQVENQVSPPQNTVEEKENEISSTNISQNDRQESPIQQEIPNPTQHNASDEVQRQETSLNGIVNEESKPSDPQRNENETPFHNLQQETPKHPKEASIQQAQLELIENTPQNQETQ